MSRDQRRRVAGEGGRRVGGGAQAGERRRDGGGLVEEVADGPALGHRLLPEREAQDAVGAARRVAVVLYGDGHGGERRLRAEQAQGLRERRRVQVAGGDLGGGASGRRRSTSSAAPSPTTRAPSARTLSRSSAKLAAADSVATNGRPAARCAFIACVTAPPPMTGPRKTTVWPRAVAAAIRAPATCVAEGTTSLTAFSSGWPGRVRRMSLVPAPTSIARTPAGCAAEVTAAEGFGCARQEPQPACRVGTWLKRSFQTFFMASTTMSLLILLSPTLRSTKMMGSSTTLNPSL